MKIGIQVSSLKPLLTNEAEVAAAFARMAQMGVDTVQLQWVDPSVSIDAIAQALAENGIQSLSVQDFSTAILQNPGYYYELNRKTGGAWLCPSRVPEGYSLSQYAEVLERIRAESGQRICFHPVAADLAPRDGIYPVEFLMEQLPWMELCFDLYHLNKAGLDMPQWIRKYPGRIPMVHFKEGKRQPDGTEILVPAGQGDIDWTGVVDACRDAGVPYALVEQERWDRDPYMCLGEALVWLQEELCRKSP